METAPELGSTSGRPPRSTRPHNRQRVARATVVATLAVGLAAGTLGPVSTTGADAAPGAPTVQPAAKRITIPPNVAYPIPGAGKYSPRDTRATGPKMAGTEILAPCGTPVVAAHPGRVRLVKSAWAGGTYVRIEATPGGVSTWYAHLSKVSVSNGQIMQAGQPVGTVGRTGNAKACELHFEVRDGRAKPNPTTWLDRYVGKTVPSSRLFGRSGFNLATFNTLGASHTDKGGSAPTYPPYSVRVPKMIDVLSKYRADVIGLQEFQKRQRSLFLSKAGKTYGIYPSSAKADSENSLIWRNAAFQQVEAKTVAVPYFNGGKRQMPYVLLRERATGKTAWFINVHNPANTRRFPRQEKWRAAAIKVERDLIVRLRASGRPVFLTGDLNDRSKAFCPLTAGKLSIDPQSVPSMQCAMPPKAWIDWIFAAGPARFSSYQRTWYPRDIKAADHPLVIARTYLAD